MLEEFTVYIDARPIHILDVWMHYQSDPYPGGNVYELHSTDPILLEQFKSKFGTGFHKKINNEHDTLMSIWVSIQSKYQRPGFMDYFKEWDGWQFVLNTVDLMRVSERKVVLCGTCSQFLKNWSRQENVK